MLGEFGYSHLGTFRRKILFSNVPWEEDLASGAIRDIDYGYNRRNISISRQRTHRVSGKP